MGRSQAGLFTTEAPLAGSRRGGGPRGRRRGTLSCMPPDPRDDPRDDPLPVVTLVCRPPYDWPALLAFLAARATPGVEVVDGDRYRRTVRVGGHAGVVSVRPARGAPAGVALLVEPRSEERRGG